METEEEKTLDPQLVEAINYLITEGKVIAFCPKCEFSLYQPEFYKETCNECQAINLDKITVYYFDNMKESTENGEMVLNCFDCQLPVSFMEYNDKHCNNCDKELYKVKVQKVIAQS